MRFPLPDKYRNISSYCIRKPICTKAGYSNRNHNEEQRLKYLRWNPDGTAMFFVFPCCCHILFLIWYSNCQWNFCLSDCQWISICCPKLLLIRNGQCYKAGWRATTSGGRDCWTLHIYLCHSRTKDCSSAVFHRYTGNCPLSHGWGYRKKWQWFLRYWLREPRFLHWNKVYTK